MTRANTIAASTARGQRPRGLPAFTLIEMVVSLTVITIVFLAMGSVMLLATKAIPRPDSPTNLRLEATDVLEQITSELQVATSIIAATDKGITFTVPDRDNDAVDENIMYQWGGVAGNPLARQYNGGNKITILPDIKGFELIYDTKEVVVTGEPVTSAEVVLASHDTVVNSQDYIVDQNHWIGQCLMPQNLPADALTWSATRVYISAAANGMPDGTALVQLRQDGPDGLPTDVVIEAYPMHEWDLSPLYYSWRGFTFSDVRGFLPGSCVSLVVKWQGGVSACYIQWDSKSGSGYFKTGNGEGHWSMDANKSMVYYLYGTYTTPGTTTVYNILRSVSMTLIPNSDPTSQARSSAVVLNQPQMP
jgi:type II secretory pathway pseudopilin PulG